MTLDSRFCDGYLTIGRRGSLGKKPCKQTATIKTVNHVVHIFHAAVEDGDITQVKLLLKYGNINLEDLSNNGRTPVQEACLQDEMEILRLLIDYGACLETRDTYGWTVLHYASFFGNVDAVRLLILNCADVEAINSNGETPFDLASNSDVKCLLANYIKPVRRGKSLETDSDSDSDFVDESQSIDSNLSNHDSLFDSGFDFNQSRDSDEEDLFEYGTALRRKFNSSLTMSNMEKVRENKKYEKLNQESRVKSRCIEYSTSRMLKRSLRKDSPCLLERESSNGLVVLREDQPLDAPSICKINNFKRLGEDSCQTSRLNNRLSKEKRPLRSRILSRANESSTVNREQNETTEQALLPETRTKIQNFRSTRKRLRLLSLRKVRSESDITQLTDDSTFKTPKIKKVSNTQQLNLIGE